MRSKFKWIFTLLVALTMQFSFAQEKTVTGVVTDATGPLPGANVIVKGTTRGTQTDFDGKFAIKAKAGEVLEISFIGLANQSVTIGSANSYNLKLGQAPDVLGEVVVTTFGQKKTPRELAYASQSVKSKELVQAAPINAVTALAGKVSGLNILTKNNGVNPTTGIVLRGYKSLSGNNQALIVIDGVIQADSALNNLNPNDIESVTVLKSSNATVLYGSQGSNGAMIVTTRTGSEGKLQVGFNSSYTVESVKYFPELQTKFGPGFDGIYDPIENTNWGPRFDGVPRRVGPILADGSFQTVNYSPVKNGRKDFFVDGVTAINGVSIAGGDANSKFFFSAQHTDVTGITPKDEYVKNNFRLNASRKAGKFEVGTNISYYNDRTNVVGVGGYQNRDIYWNVINTAANVRLTDYKDWRNNPFAAPEGYYNEYYQNPYMLVDKNRNTSNASRLLANVKFEYEFTKNLKATYSLAGTFFNTDLKNTRAATTYNPLLAPRRAANNTPAYVATQVSSNERINSDLFLNYDKDLNKNLNLKVTLGTALNTFSSNRITISGQNLLFPGLYDPATGTGQLSDGSLVAEYDLDSSGNREFRTRLFGYYADATLGINNYLFVNGAFRRDRTSQLSDSYFDYYAAGLALDITKLVPTLRGTVLDYAKLSGGLSKTGNGTPPFQGWTNQLFSSPAGFPYGSTPGYVLPTYSVNPNLTPEFTTNKEISLELDFFNKRISLSSSYYIANSNNQFLSSGVSTASGSATYRTNAGEIQNKGLEIDLSLVPIRTKDIEWRIGGNISKIQNEVVSLADGAQRVQVGLATTQIGVFAQVGSSYPSIFGTAYLRDDQGRVIVNSSGNPQQDPVLKNLGSTTPNLIIGFNTAFTYKQITLSAVADYKTGHVYYNNLVDALEFTGSTTHSVSANRQPFIFPNSSSEDPLNPGSYIPNTSITTSDGGYSFWYNTYNPIKENYVVDATTFKLREVALSYEFPSKFLKNTAISSINLGFVARNVLMLRSAQNKYSDPEFTNDSQQVGGFGTQSQLPPTGSYGFKLDVKF